jgi:hypothetical protein
MNSPNNIICMAMMIFHIACCCALKYFDFKTKNVKRAPICSY